MKGHKMGIFFLGFALGFLIAMIYSCVSIENKNNGEWGPNSIREGMVRKGGINRWPGKDFKSRPAPPAPMVPRKMDRDF